MFAIFGASMLARPRKGELCSPERARPRKGELCSPERARPQKGELCPPARKHNIYPNKVSSKNIANAFIITILRYFVNRSAAKWRQTEQINKALKVLFQRILLYLLF
jgi:hypothetical protein